MAVAWHLIIHHNGHLTGWRPVAGLINNDELDRPRAIAQSVGVDGGQKAVDDRVLIASKIAEGAGAGGCVFNFIILKALMGRGAGVGVSAAVITVVWVSATGVVMAGVPINVAPDGV
jgi:uncharacterized spore protein YtfJ